MAPNVLPPKSARATREVGAVFADAAQDSGGEGGGATGCWQSFGMREQATDKCVDCRNECGFELTGLGVGEVTQSDGDDDVNGGCGPV